MSSSSEENQRVVMDRAYANGEFIPGAEAYFPRWEARAAAFRANLGSRARLDLAYGPGARQRFDLFLPEGRPQGLALFFHGGYWMAGDRSLWSHLAAGPLARGWAVALPSYTLAPEARIAEMTAEADRALAAAAALVEGPIAVTGHSAGGHLAARLACAEAPLPAELAARLRHVVPISPLADLRPLRLTAMNDTLRLDAAEAEAESPALLPRRPGCAVTVHVGQQERPAFLWQARLLSEEWDCPWQVAPGRHHFDVIDELEEPDSPLTTALLGP
ncbi:alpha/beta hydrolase [Cereibacter changlensis]|nr:alpha/beta hydrolase [Cereibacter changlensis]PZX52231.1 alpha/beta hydrolase family protein [Cereibacter changlensis]